MPGLVDSHVHINDPGRADWEGFDTATRAAAAGGITTLVDMPLNSIPSTTTVAALEAKRRAADGRCHVDVGFWGGVVPGNARDLEPLARAGVLGFKCFLSPSGVDEFAHVSEADLREAMPIVAATGLPLLVHAEWPALLREPDRRADPRRYATWLDSRPPHRRAGGHRAADRTVGAHLRRACTSCTSRPPTRSRRFGGARAGGVPITVETCPHYLTFCAEDVADGDTALKCAPPIRETRASRAAVARAWPRAHRPGRDRPLAGARRRSSTSRTATSSTPGAGLPRCRSRCRSSGPARRARAHPDRAARAVDVRGAGPARRPRRAQRARSQPGHDADLVIVDPDREMTVDASRLYHRHAVTPYDGARLRGVVMATMLRGEIVFEHGDCVGAADRQTAVRLIPDCLTT